VFARVPSWVLLNAENSGKQRDQCVRDLYVILVACGPSLAAERHNAQHRFSIDILSQTYFVTRVTSGPHTYINSHNSPSLSVLPPPKQLTLLKPKHNLYKKALIFYWGKQSPAHRKFLKKCAAQGRFSKKHTPKKSIKYSVM
jgi:hypothetical protein